MSNEISRTLVFLDIDGTLIMENQQPNTDQLPRVIKSISDKHIYCGLNSNRALEDVVDIYQKFGLNSPIILENGVYYLNSLDDEPHFLINNPVDVSTVSKNALVRFLATRKDDIHFECVDSTKVIVDGSYKNYDCAIYLNEFRKFTGSIHVYSKGKRDPKLASEIKIFLDEYFKDIELDMTVLVPPAFGNLVFWPSTASKGNALRVMREQDPSLIMYMIGDDLGDLDTMSQVNGFYTIANAQPEVKKKANYVSAFEYTQGVVDILERIAA